MFIKLENGFVIDTGFEVNYEAISNPIGGVGGWYGIFLVYEIRGENVGANMALAFKYWSEYCSRDPDPYMKLTIEDIMRDNELHNALYPKYKNDIEKYLMLM